MSLGYFKGQIELRPWSSLGQVPGKFGMIRVGFDVQFVPRLQQLCVVCARKLALHQGYYKRMELIQIKI
jgi:hypothetical protein